MASSKRINHLRACPILLTLVLLAAACSALVSHTHEPAMDQPQKVMILAYTPHSGIFIDGNSGFLGSNESTGISWGNGSASDPYVIEGLEVNLGIQISNSTVHFIIIDNLCGFIALYNVSNGTVFRNTCTIATFGIYLPYGIYLNGSHGNNLVDNNCPGLYTTGILLYNSTRNDLTGNLCSMNQVGIRLSKCTSNLVSNNNLSVNYNGLIAAGSSDNTYRNNTCSLASWGGFMFESSNDSTIDSNTCTDSGFYGISLVNSSRNAFSSNIVFNTSAGVGMSLTNSHDDTLFDNSFTSNIFGGISLVSCSDATIFNNTFSLGGPGATMDSMSSDNRVWNNTFYHTAGTGDTWVEDYAFMVQAYDSGMGNWWNSTDGYGNYWCEWQLPDIDDDGVVDNPYCIGGEAGAKDYFPLIRDTDNDGIPDSWESSYGLNPWNASDALLDLDADGLKNIEEFLNGTSPIDPDTDDDGMWDGWEVGYSLDPLDGADALGDADSDELLNLAEYLVGADPSVSDSDSDGIPDGWEMLSGLNPLNSSDAALDMDNDGLSAYVEYGQGSNPWNPDTDGDGIPDGYEYDTWFYAGVNHLSPVTTTDASLDPDNDGLNNLAEYLNGTSIVNADTDSDGLPDGWEVVNELNPLYPEDAYHDADSDGLTNVAEYEIQTDPNSQDTDRDGLNDGDEVIFSKTDPTKADTDGDGISDYLQFIGEGGYATAVQGLADNWIGMRIFWSGYVISVKTNSSVLSATFDKENRSLTIGVSGPNGTRGFCEIVVPKAMIALESSIAVFLDDEELNFTLGQDSTYYIIDMDYTHSTHELRTDFAYLLVTPPPPPETVSRAIPLELVISLLIVALAIVMVVLVVIRRRGKREMNQDRDRQQNEDGER